MNLHGVVNKGGEAELKVRLDHISVHRVVGSYLLGAHHNL